MRLLSSQSATPVPALPAGIKLNSLAPECVDQRPVGNTGRAPAAELLIISPCIIHAEELFSGVLLQVRIGHSGATNPAAQVHLSNNRQLVSSGGHLKRGRGCERLPSCSCPTEAAEWTPTRSQMVRSQRETDGSKAWKWGGKGSTCAHTQAHNELMCFGERQRSQKKRTRAAEEAAERWVGGWLGGWEGGAAALGLRSRDSKQHRGFRHKPEDATQNQQQPSTSGRREAEVEHKEVQLARPCCSHSKMDPVRC